MPRNDFFGGLSNDHFPCSLHSRPLIDVDPLPLPHKNQVSLIFNVCLYLLIKNPIILWIKYSYAFWNSCILVPFGFCHYCIEWIGFCNYWYQNFHSLQLLFLLTFMVRNLLQLGVLYCYCPVSFRLFSLEFLLHADKKGSSLGLLCDGT